MKVKIRRTGSSELVSAIIRAGTKTEMPSLNDGWMFNFYKHVQVRGKQGFVLFREETPYCLEGCMIFSIHKTYGPYLDYLEVAPHNKGENGRYKRIAGCLIAYACGLSFENGRNEDRGFLCFQAYGGTQESTAKLKELYREKYGAKMNPMGIMEIYPEQSHVLIETYLMI